ncbi:hypothetical protein CHUAL_009175 [Chamberlinius hualienensis]
MSFVSGIWSFFKRHRRKFFVFGAVTGGLAVINYYGRRKLREWQERESHQYLERLKREQHFESTQKTCKAMTGGIISTFVKKISNLADCEGLTAKLKDKPNNKIELWQELKCSTFAKLVSQIYGCSVIATMLNVQLNIIGGYMFLDAVSSSDPKFQNSTQAQNAPLHIQQKYLELIQQFLEVGAEKLYHFVLSSTHDCMDKTALNEKLTLADLQVILNAVRANFIKSVKETDPTDLDLFSFVLTTELLSSLDRQNFETTPTTSRAFSTSPFMLENSVTSSAVSSSGNERISNYDQTIYKRLINETRDLFESEDCKNIVSLTADVAFSYIYDNLIGYFVDLNGQNEFNNPNETALPVAKIIPIVCVVTSKCFDDGTELVSRMLTEQKVLAANIYESFSQENRVNDFRNHNTTLI